mmetsp:Transcript_17224/g.47710  ORF Transcript_17224/g.47710 Transcript_17224/m.47710 type:complete len:255 (-) Transcript_17224:63-827(-)
MPRLAQYVVDIASGEGSSNKQQHSCAQELAPEVNVHRVGQQGAVVFLVQHKGGRVAGVSLELQQRGSARLRRQLRTEHGSVALRSARLLSKTTAAHISLQQVVPIRRYHCSTRYAAQCRKLSMHQTALLEGPSPQDLCKNPADDVLADCACELLLNWVQLLLAQSLTRQPIGKIPCDLVREQTLRFLMSNCHPQNVRIVWKSCWPRKACPDECHASTTAHTCYELGRKRAGPRSFRIVASAGPHPKTKVNQGAP